MSMVMFGGQRCFELLLKLWQGNLTQKSDRNMREIIRIVFGLPGLGFGLEFGKGVIPIRDYRSLTERLFSKTFPGNARGFSVTNNNKFCE